MKNFLFPFLLITMFCIPACSDDDGSDGGNGGDVIPATTEYNGTLIVNGSFRKENTNCKIQLNETSDSLTLDICEVKFAENMPVAIDIMTKIPCSVTNDKIVFDCDSVVPFIGVVPAPQFKFYKIQGQVDDYDFAFSAELTRGVFTFTGVKVETE